jgi:hypothetical protein
LIIFAEDFMSRVDRAYDEYLPRYGGWILSYELSGASEGQMQRFIIRVHTAHEEVQDLAKVFFIRWFGADSVSGDVC